MPGPAPIKELMWILCADWFRMSSATEAGNVAIFPGDNLGGWIMEIKLEKIRSWIGVGEGEKFPGMR